MTPPRKLPAVFALLLVALFCGGQSVEPNSHPSIMGRKIAQKGLPNLGQVTPMLYRGALPSAEGIETLQKMGIDIVVDLRPGPHASEEQTVTKRGMRYVSLPSVCYAPKDETFARFLALVRGCGYARDAGLRLFLRTSSDVPGAGGLRTEFSRAAENQTRLSGLAPKT